MQDNVDQPKNDLIEEIKEKHPDRIKEGTLINCYDILNISKNSTSDEINKAYKKESKEHHPDTIWGSNEKQQYINKAKEILDHYKEEYDLYYDKIFHTH